MNESANLRLVQDAYAAFSRGDIAAVLALLADEVDWQSLGPAELALCSRRRGKAQVAEFFKTLGETWHVEGFEPRDYVAQGDHVAAFGAFAAKSVATGRSIRSEWAHHFTVRDGKCTRWREYTDTAQAVAALSATAMRG